MALFLTCLSQSLITSAACVPLTPFSRVSAASASFPSARRLSTLFIIDSIPSPDWSASLTCSYKQSEKNAIKERISICCHYLLIMHYKTLSGHIALVNAPSTRTQHEPKNGSECRRRRQAVSG